MSRRPAAHSTNDRRIDQFVCYERIRSFPHERRKIPSFMFISCDASSVYNDFCDLIVSKLNKEVKLKVVPDPHISLSRTFVLAPYSVESFKTSVEQRLKPTSCFSVKFGGMAVYVNREKSRTFLALNVQYGIDDLSLGIDKINECFDDFQIPRYYKKPSFHMSIASCFGDKKTLIESLLPYLEENWRNLLDANPSFLNLEVTRFNLKIGNKISNFQLS